jgi:signal transduction histidine kinase
MEFAQNAVNSERASARVAELQETVSALEGMCYGIAHDLQSPIRSMHGLACALEEQHPDAAELASKMKTASQRMDQMVQDLLRSGRLSHGELNLSSLSLETEVDFLLKELNNDILRNHAVIRVDRPLPTVMANRAILQQVLTNLLSNAWKFVRFGIIPRIQISAQNGPMVRICIQDNGIGIDPRFHEQIFKIFERLHPKETYAGTGIGLAIVKKGVQRMGGRVGVESEPGKGSMFWIELPAGAKEKPLTEPYTQRNAA